ncbi:Hypothetical predicted protein [Pelobates cultripes]|uniref:Uncharacterized protein n=1 Tax=Pelobates cultripes TaxID=61616 RepID=A0AAD1SBA6_PELCU|nr:Hypothetical predicted protein [Pelobates cultripes]
MMARSDSGVNSMDSQVDSTASGDTISLTTLLEEMAEQDPLAPATKQDIANLLRELDTVRTEVQMVKACTQATEEEVLDLKREVQVLKYQMQSLQHSYLNDTEGRYH